VNRTQHLEIVKYVGNIEHILGLFTSPVAIIVVFMLRWQLAGRKASPFIVSMWLYQQGLFCTWNRWSLR